MMQANEVENNPLSTPMRLYNILLRQFMAYRDQNL